MAKGPSDCLPFGGGAGGKLFGYSWMQERKLAKWSEMVEKWTQAGLCHDEAAGTLALDENFGEQRGIRPLQFERNR